MSFSPEAVETLLVKSVRHCCICRRHKGQKIRIHHIVPSAQGGLDTEENGIPVCSDCHDDVMSYNNDHPGGRKYQPSELKRLRDDWFAHVAAQPSLAESESPVVETVIGDRNVVGRIIQVNPRIVKKSIVQPGPEHVTDAQALQIRNAVIDLWDTEREAGHAGSPGKWYNKLYNRFDVTSYQRVRAEQFEEVMAWLKQQRAMLQPRLRRTNNPAWRKKRYGAIWARAKQLGMSKEQVYIIATQRLKLATPVDSLTGLGEQNLDHLYRALFSIRN